MLVGLVGCNSWLVWYGTMMWYGWLGFVLVAIVAGCKCWFIFMVWFGLFAIVLVAIVCSWLVVSVGET